MRAISSVLGGLILAVAATASPQDRRGLKIEDVNHVTCSRPTRNGDKIAVHYRGRLQSNGEEFDESYKRGAPFTFKLGAHMVIAGWDQGLLAMCPGQKRTLTIPPEMAYGHRGVGGIPADSTLVFETELVEIIGVKQESLVTVGFASTSTSAAVTSTISSAIEEEGAFSIATAPATPPSDAAKGHEETAGKENDISKLVGTPLDANKDKGEDPVDDRKAECRLLGPFALLVQAALGAVALLSLIWKRYRETPKRPWKIFTFDVSKQVLGSMLTHVLNLAMSMLGSGEILSAVEMAVEAAATGKDDRTPNPCSFYLLNLAIDTTIGIPVLYLLLRILHAVALRTPLARPPQSIKSGSYDRPPRTTWWLKQLLIYFLGLVGMKLFVLFLFKAMPWLPWVGDWALRWTRGNEALEVTFAMFIFPLIMNGLQYWIIDNLIKEKHDGGKGYKQVHGDEDEDDEHSRLNTDRDDEYTTDDTIVAENDTLKDTNPTPIPVYEEDHPHGTANARTTSAAR